MRTLILILFLFPFLSFSQNTAQYDSLLNHYLYKQLYQETIETLLKDSTDLQSWQYMAKVSELQYTDQQAEFAWNRVLLLDSVNYQALNGLQKLYLAQERYNEALSISFKMNSILPKQLRNWWAISLTTNKLKEYSNSHRWCDTILNIYPDFQKASHLKALNLLELKDTVTALNIWRSLYQKYPSDKYLRQMAYTAANHQYNDTILKDILNRIDVDATNAYLYKMAGYLYFSKKSLIDASIKLREAFDLGDTTDFTKRFLGMAAFQIEDYSTAYYQLKSIHGIEENRTLFYMMSMAHARMMGNKESLELLKKTYEMYYAPKFIAGILDELAETYKKVGERLELRGMIQQSKEHYNEAIQNQTTSLKTHYTPMSILRIGVIYDIYMKNIDKALKYYQRYIEESKDTVSKNYKFTHRRIQLLKEDKHFLAN